MATLAPRGRIRVEEVDEEIARLRESWRRPGTAAPAAETVRLADVVEADVLEKLDPFDRVQLAHVVAVCRRCRSISDAGRELFAVSRAQRTVTNDADRLRKYLARFGLTFGKAGGFPKRSEHLSSCESQSGWQP